jgi:hypothetical protein
MRLMGIFFILFSVSVSAQEDSAEMSFEDALSGFGEESAENSAESSAEDWESGFDETDPDLGQSDKMSIVDVAPKYYLFSGSIGVNSAYNYAHTEPEQGSTDYQALSKLRPVAHGVFDYKTKSGWAIKVGAKVAYDAIFDLQNENNYTTQTVDKNRIETEWEDVYLSGSLNASMDIRIGRQVISWGKSDNLQVVDVFNPSDFREPGVADVKELLLPVAMTRLDYYFGNWNVNVIVTHETRFGKAAPCGHDFYALGFQNQQSCDFFETSSPEDNQPDGLTEPQYGVALNGTFSGWDLSFHVADYWNSRPYLEQNKLAYARTQMFGLAGNVARGAWLWKTELGYFQGLKYLSTLDSKSSYSALAGTEYSGITDLTLSMEVMYNHLNEYEKDKNILQGSQELIVPVSEDSFQLGLSARYDFSHNTNHLSFFMLALGQDFNDGGVQRLSLQHDLMDALSLGIGLVNYESTDTIPFKAIGNNDRIVLDMVFSF